MLRISLKDLSSSNEDPPGKDAKGFPFTKGSQRPGTAVFSHPLAHLSVIEQKTRFV